MSLSCIALEQKFNNIKYICLSLDITFYIIISISENYVGILKNDDKRGTTKG